jgi:hypothetical protein
MAAFMACGHAKFTGEIGVCVATSAGVEPTVGEDLDMAPEEGSGHAPKPGLCFSGELARSAASGGMEL